MSIIVSFGRNPNKCEILCHKDSVTLYRQDKLPKNKVLVTDTIFKNAQKGDSASNELIQKTFGHTNVEDAIEQLLREGDYSMSTVELRSLKEAAYRGVVSYIKKNYLNPIGDREYTESSIESALDLCRCKATVDHRKSSEDNFNAVKKKLLGKLPMKPKPGSIPYSVSLTWTQHSKLYTQFKPFVQSETTSSDGKGYVLELLVPPKDMDRIMRLTA